jgi:tetratricopeptide (TPR) repeat protein
MTNGFYYRGLSYKGKREWDAAIGDFTTALRREPESTLALAERGITYRHKGQTERAFSDFDEMIRLKPNDPLGYALRADTLEMAEQEDAALEVAATALRLDPKLALAYDVRGRVYHGRTEYEKADREFSEAERLEPRRIENALASASAFRRKGDYKLAAVELRETVERFPRSAYAHNALAWFLATCPDATSRHGADALAHAKSACELTKWNDPDYLDTLAAAYAEMGDFDQAIKYVREAIAKLEPQSENRREIEEHLVLFQRKEPCRDKR